MGDHMSLDLHIAVLPPKTEVVVFSIDGSFTASVSVTGKDPKVRPSSVDVVRHWQDLGYLIIYVTGRPCMQLRKVVSWLSMPTSPRVWSALLMASPLIPWVTRHSSSDTSSKTTLFLFKLVMVPAKISLSTTLLVSTPATSTLL